MSSGDSIQLEMNFTPPVGNRFRRELDNAGFVLLFEQAAPARDNDLTAAAERLRALEEAVLAVPGEMRTGLALTDCRFSTEAWRPTEYAAGLSADNRDRHLLYLSGRNDTPERFREQLQLARAQKFPNLVIPSGGHLRGDDRRRVQHRYYRDALELIPEAVKAGFFCGGVVNPFCYTPWSLLPTYRKLENKFATGAEFVVTQAGWDMLRLQALRWYLCGLELYFPTLARLVLLTPEKVEGILGGDLPGVTISDDFRKILETELRFSNAQFEAAQYRRLELQVAGCRLLGFSGVQISGVEVPGRIASVGERVNSALEEFESFDAWLEAYNSHLAMTEMAPKPRTFALYDRLLHRAQPEIIPPSRDPGVPQVTLWEKLGYYFRRFWFSRADRQHDERALLKRLFAGCRNCGERCALPACEFRCPAECPKKLREICGGVDPDGNCTVPGVGECVFHRIGRLRYWRKLRRERKEGRTL